MFFHKIIFYSYICSVERHRYSTSTAQNINYKQKHVVSSHMINDVSLIELFIP